jgi:hypothetical protein
LRWATAEPFRAGPALQEQLLLQPPNSLLLPLLPLLLLLLLLLVLWLSTSCSCSWTTAVLHTLGLNPVDKTRHQPASDRAPQREHVLLRGQAWHHPAAVRPVQAVYQC